MSGRPGGHFCPACAPRSAASMFNPEFAEIPQRRTERLSVWGTVKRMPGIRCYCCIPCAAPRGHGPHGAVRLCGFSANSVLKKTCSGTTRKGFRSVPESNCGKCDCPAGGLEVGFGVESHLRLSSYAVRRPCARDATYVPGRMAVRPASVATSLTCVSVRML